MVKVSALLLLIAFVTNPLTDQLHSFFSVSEHPMQAGSTVRKIFFVCPVCVCVCVWGGGEAPLPPPPPLYPPLGVALQSTLNPRL